MGYPGVELTVTDHLDVQIAPAEVTEGQSAVLTCKTTCNLTDPTFIWYKNSHHLTTKTSEGNEVRLQSVSSEDAGSYSCANKHGSERSAAVTVTLKGSQSVGVYAGLGVVLFVCICLTVTFWCIRKKKRAGSTPDQSLRQDNLYANIANPTNTVSDSASAHQDEVLYASVVHQRAVDPRKAESSAVKASASEDGEVQYASVRFKRTTTADYRPSNVEDPTVISSRVK
ncbi:hypothetical protein KOW79_020992 [Hemibagrus wyckioides]|uniref:Ig-like domain-containing protein n=1 Tax=Hemibagrus wyckioides TaxID=337641 RepID=A0A9D3N4X0_9TELE|nr:hypothetical protein KOW79_020992 [Hemibagrus wyckioides]